jgi:NAD(P)-dependent dehydrogenase (short-subunit alcohol dehydrogenase family)
MRRGFLAGAAVLAAGAAWTARRARPGDDLTGLVALVTGGSRGLGYLIARELLRQGCRVAICARDATTLLRARDRLRRETGGDVLAVPCDVTDAEAVSRFVDDVLAHYGRVDIIVNNAAIIQVGPLETLDASDFRSAMDVAYFGTVHTTLAVLPHMQARGTGRIANITSIGGRVAVPHLLPYDAAKFATIGFSEGLRAELAGDGIAVTTVVPWLMRTGSPVHVEYRGQPAKEYVWFALGGTLPFSAMSASRAARRIVRAIRRREALLTLSWQAHLVRLAHDLAPATTTRALGLVGRLLPKAGNGRSARGDDLRGTLPAVLEAALDRAGQRSNQ